jgi:transposase-like protein
VARRLPPVQAIRAEIDALFTEGRDLVEVLEDVARLGAHLIIQTAVEAEVDAFLGRARYQRASTVTSSDEEHAVVRPGHRNGHCPATIKTTTGPVTIARPKLRGTTEAFASRPFGAGVTRTNALESLVIASFVRGLSVRDVEGALADALGPEAALSKSLRTMPTLAGLLALLPPPVLPLVDP